MSEAIPQSARVAIDSNRETVIVVREDENTVSFVQMHGGALKLEIKPAAEFNAKWSTLPYPLGKAVNRYLEHATKRGASVEAMNALKGLAEGTTDQAVCNVSGGEGKARADLERLA